MSHCLSHYAKLVTQTQSTLANIASDFTPAAFASSLAAEDMVLTDLIWRGRLPINIFSLDTGRLHTATLGMLGRIRETYGIEITLYRPQQQAVDHYVRQNGLNALYDSVALRQECCRIRKVEPLQRALAGRRAWLTGQRRAQSATRSALPGEEWDNTHGMIKFNPLAEWSTEDVWHYLKWNQVPYNPLHDQGYPSIGCEPCTRAIRSGEDIRAGRWWWENAQSRECGLHNKAKKQLYQHKTGLGPKQEHT